MAVEGNGPGVALITGGGGGIGGATARLLASDGVAVAVADADRDLAEEAAAGIRAAGGRALAIPLDVTDPGSVARAVRAAEDGLGPIDGLVNAAGIFGWAAMEEIDDDAFEAMFRVHVFGMHAVCRATVPAMASRGRGAVVNITSIHAIRGQANAVHYASAKGAILSYTKSLARETAPRGVRVNAVAPGPIDTPMLRGGMDDDEAERRFAERVKIIPAGRLGAPEEIAAGIAFLLSPSASYLTGHVMTIDGGEVMN